MKNVEKPQLKKCIFMLCDEFELIMKRLGFNAECGYDGIYFSKANEIIYDEDAYKALSDYFDVKVTSVHCDDCEYMGAWIVYKEKEI